MSNHHALYRAVHWFMRLRSKPDADRRPFFRWLRHEPRAIEEYDALETLWASLEELRGDADLSRELSAPHPQRLRLRPMLAASALAAAIVALCVGAGWWVLTPRTDVYVAAAMQRTIALQDGSRLALEPGAEVRVRFSAKRRDVRLLAGEASFDVASAPERPFYIDTPAAQLLVVGTKFKLELSGQSLRLSVFEGKVRVAGDTPADVSAGQVVAIAPDTGLVWAPSTTLGRDAPARLQFSATPLGEAVASMNRSGGSPLRLADPALSDIPISGVFLADETHAFARALEALGLVQVESRDDAVILHPPDEGP